MVTSADESNKLENSKEKNTVNFKAVHFSDISLGDISHLAQEKKKSRISGKKRRKHKTASRGKLWRSVSFTLFSHRL